MFVRSVWEKKVSADAAASLAIDGMMLMCCGDSLFPPSAGEEEEEQTTKVDQARDPRDERPHRTATEHQQLSGSVLQENHRKV
jgi:hypothetical protein